jgi:multidrug efflux pump subunit AcrA (membrane-fusion protein)
MKRKFSGKIWLLLLVAFVIFSCKEKTNISVTTHEHGSETQYTCPMHPEIIRDKPGTCPICGMDLVPMAHADSSVMDTSLLALLKPVNQQVIASIPTITADNAMRIFSVPVQGVITYDTRKQVTISSRVAGRIERMYIKYNYQPVSKGQLIMEIYSPDLVAAQRELIYISRNDNNSPLLQKARQKLNLLGMQPAHIAQVERTGKPLYRVPVYSTVSGYIIEKSLSATTSNTTAVMPPVSSSSGGMNEMGGETNNTNTILQQPSFNQSPVIIREGQYVGAGETVFTIYQSGNMIAEFSFTPALASEIKQGQKLVFRTTANPDDVRTGTIGLIEPVQKNGQSFTVARVYLPNSNLQPGQLLTANIPVVKKNAYWLPENAVLQLGKRSVVFKKEEKVFVPKEVNTGVRTEGLVEVVDSIYGWQIAKNASFLVDSESFIKTTSNNQK